MSNRYELIQGYMDAVLASRREERLTYALYGWIIFLGFVAGNFLEMWEIGAIGFVSVVGANLILSVYYRRLRKRLTQQYFSALSTMIADVPPIVPDTPPASP